MIVLDQINTVASFLHGEHGVEDLMKYKNRSGRDIPCASYDLFNGLPDAILWTVLNEWMNDEKELAAFDIAICNEKLRERYLTARKTIHCFSRSSILENNSPRFKRFMRWKYARNVIMLSLELFYWDQDCIEALMEDVRHLTLHWTAKNTNTQIWSEDKCMPLSLLSLLRQFPKLQSLTILYAEGFFFTLQSALNDIPDIHTRYRLTSLTMQPETITNNNSNNNNNHTTPQVVDEGGSISYMINHEHLEIFVRVCPFLTSMHFPDCTFMDPNTLYSMCQHAPQVTSLQYHAKGYGSSKKWSAVDRDHQLQIEEMMLQTHSYPLWMDYFYPIVRQSISSLHTFTFHILNEEHNRLLSQILFHSGQKVAQQMRKITLYHAFQEELVTAIALSCPGLTSLHLQQNDRITDHVVEMIGTHLLCLQHLSLIAISQLSHQSITGLCPQSTPSTLTIPPLRSIHLTGCLRIPASSFHQFLSYYTGLEEIVWHLPYNSVRLHDVLLDMNRLYPNASRIRRLELCCGGGETDWHGCSERLWTEWKMHRLQHVSLTGIQFSAQDVKELLSQCPSLHTVEVTVCAEEVKVHPITQKIRKRTNYSKVKMVADKEIDELRGWLESYSSLQSSDYNNRK